MYRGEKLNSITHLTGMAFALAGLIVLVVSAGRQGDPWKIVSFSIYGATLVALYFFSALYHSSTRGKAKTVLQKLDHVAIYLLIAGTYTPFTLVTLRGSWGWSLFGVVWAFAVAGVVQEVLLAKGKRVLSVVIYILMGWLMLVAVRPLVQALPRAGMAWLVAGGLFYTGGIFFYVRDKKLAHGHGIWHFFVLAGSVCHYLAVLFYVA